MCAKSALGHRSQTLKMRDPETRVEQHDGKKVVEIYFGIFKVNFLGPLGILIFIILSNAVSISLRSRNSWGDL